MATLQEIAQKTVDVQNACNIIAVSLSFSQVLKDLRELMEQDEEGYSSDRLCKHPITQAWIDKLASLSDIQANPFLGLNCHMKVDEIIRGERKL